MYVCSAVLSTDLEDGRRLAEATLGEAVVGRRCMASTSIPAVAGDGQLSPALLVELPRLSIGGISLLRTPCTVALRCAMFAGIANEDEGLVRKALRVR